ncbi:MAG: hypothetical protein ACI9UT_000369, partial [Flavobacteriales bacterium]
TINQLQAGDKIYFTFEIQNDDFVITDYVLTNQDHYQEQEQEQVHSHD